MGGGHVTRVERRWDEGVRLICDGMRLCESEVGGYDFFFSSRRRHTR